MMPGSIIDLTYYMDSRKYVKQGTKSPNNIQKMNTVFYFGSVQVQSTEQELAFSMVGRARAR